MSIYQANCPKCGRLKEEVVCDVCKGNGGWYAPRIPGYPDVGPNGVKAGSWVTCYESWCQGRGHWWMSGCKYCD